MDAGEPVPRPDDGPADVGPDARVAGGEVRWKLRRGAGSAWTVTDLSLAPDGLRVSGYRYVRDRDAPAESRREVLEDELLGAEDRVWCLDRRGSVVWRLTSPRGDRDRGADDPPGSSRGRAVPGTPGAGAAGRPAGGRGVPPGGEGPIGG